MIVKLLFGVQSFNQESIFCLHFWRFYTPLFTWHKCVVVTGIMSWPSPGVSSVGVAPVPGSLSRSPLLSPEPQSQPGQAPAGSSGFHSFLSAPAARVLARVSGTSCGRGRGLATHHPGYTPPWQTIVTPWHNYCNIHLKWSDLGEECCDREEGAWCPLCSPDLWWHDPELPTVETGDWWPGPGAELSAALEVLWWAPAPSVSQSVLHCHQCRASGCVTIQNYQCSVMLPSEKIHMWEWEWCKAEWLRLWVIILIC